jgi:hypothetical protein
MEGEKIQGVTQVAAYVDRIRIHFGSLSRAEAVNLPIPWRRRRLDRAVIDEDTHHGLLGRWTVDMVFTSYGRRPAVTTA